MMKKTKKKASVSVPKDEDFKKFVVRGKLSDANYWKWRLTIEEGSTAKAKSEVAQLRCQLKVEEIEKQKYKLILLQKSFQEAQLNIKQSSEEYDKVKGEIEEEMEISLNGCTINPYTFEVQEIPEETTKE